MRYLLYGANGYTGQIILDYSKGYGLTPVIAGRSEEKLKPLAQKYKLEYLVFDLTSHTTIVQHLQEFEIVLNCAGPFSKTAEPMVKACLEAGVHYLDITGEVAVFEWIKSQHQQAVDSKICLVPGVGFDVVPTDCVAAFLYNKMPDATHLTLAFAPVGGSVSHGTASTMVERLGIKGLVRKDGILNPVPLGHKGRYFQFGEKMIFTMTIPWGDLSTAYSSTRIPNIEVYTRVPKKVHRLMKFQGLFNWLLRQSFIKNRIQKNIDQKITGPDAEQRAKGKSLVLGIVSNEKGEEQKALFVGPEGYDYTAHAALLAVKEMLMTKNKSGYYTPSLLFGFDFASRVPDTKMEIFNN